MGSKEVCSFEFGVWSSKKLCVQNLWNEPSKLETQNSKLETQNSKLNPLPSIHAKNVLF
jgi:hypothetical protein